jgi:hypothetical protein
MDVRVRRKLEMGRSALEFSRSHPDSSAGYAAALARLEDRLTHGDAISAQQMAGLRDVRAATERKQELRSTLKLAHLAHVAEVGKAAAKELPDLGQKFVFRPGTRTYLAFRIAARGMAAEAQSHKELLVKHGLSETVLENLLQELDQFDTAVDQGVEARQAHVGASAELRSVANEVVQVVRVMDGLNQYRFKDDTEALAAWTSASNVAGPHASDTKEEPVPGEGPVAGGEVRPAA